MFLDEIKKPNSVNILLGDININALDENNSQTENILVYLRTEVLYLIAMSQLEAQTAYTIL